MKVELENIEPSDIERRSFEIIGQELGVELNPKLAPIIKRVIHTTADFDYLENLCFSENVVDIAMDIIKNNVTIVTDTTMVMAGINKKSLEKLGGRVVCYIGDSDVAEISKKMSVTRSSVCVDKASKLSHPIIYAVGNAPTSLIRLYELITDGTFKPDLIIGVPVGFVNVVQSKELIMSTDVPYIVAKGRKGGSNVCASICNAIIYMAQSR
ncbi:MAG: precorrin-8X methylmutase [Oscillospiraceae bacterium]